MGCGRSPTVPARSTEARTKKRAWFCLEKDGFAIDFKAAGAHGTPGAGMGVGGSLLLQLRTREARKKKRAEFCPEND